MVRLLLLPPAAVAIVLLAVVDAADCATYAVDQTAKAGEAIAPQHYRFYLPDGVAVIRAVIIHQHGCGRGDWNTGWDVHWRALADKWDAALVSPWLEGDCGKWARPANGSLRALTDSLAAVAVQSGHPELVNAPFCLWGHSGGGDWVAQMMKLKPAQTVAAVARSGGRDPGAECDGVPTLVVRGNAKDIGSDVRKWFTGARSRGALIALAEDLDQWHDCADLRVLAIPFFDACLAARLPPATTGAVMLQTINPASGWLGDQTSFKVGSAATFPAASRATASWLPNQNLAIKWSEFANPASPHGTGWATDTTPPDSAPWDVTATVSGASVSLGWRARADLETGIKSFAIYRDGAKVGSLGGSGNSANAGGGFFQWGDFGDEAKAGPIWPIAADSLWPFPAAYADNGAAVGAHAYQIATVNGQGLEGPRSVPIPVSIGTTDTQPPGLAINGPVAVAGGNSGKYSTAAATLAMSGTASDDHAVQTVVWSNDRGGTGVATGTTSWTITGIPLSTGTNTIHVTVWDGGNHAVTATLVAVRGGGGTRR